MNIIKLFLLLILAVSISCKKQEDCPREFVVYGKVNPYKETYETKDTLSLSIQFTNMILSRDLNKEFDLTNVNLSVGFHIYRIDSPSTGYYSSAIDYCKYIDLDTLNLNINYFSDGTSMLNGTMRVLRGTNSISIKFVPTIAGLYMLTFGVFTIQNNDQYEGGCKRSFFDLSTILNKGQDNNIDLLKQSPNEHFNTWMIQKPERFYYQKSGFAYRVIE